LALKPSDFCNTGVNGKAKHRVAFLKVMLTDVNGLHAGNVNQVDGAKQTWKAERRNPYVREDA
jgi:hypothetical protein